jgi:hypothetical protein
MKEHMDASDAVRIKYASKYAQVSELLEVLHRPAARPEAPARAGQEEAPKRTGLMAWVDADPARKAKYGGLIS